MFGASNQLKIEDAILKSGQVIRNSQGFATHRIQKSVFGDKLIISEI
ncbi:hypothetical protein IJH02_00570 [Candidatus Saccharibacteria bacterium]|nr:hypothetical protein [Candidatus Saccharibacteria bacterium]